jgi:hypothetical protein
MAGKTGSIASISTASRRAGVDLREGADDSLCAVTRDCMSPPLP